MNGLYDMPDIYIIVKINRSIYPESTRTLLEVKLFTNFIRTRAVHALVNYEGFYRGSILHTGAHALRKGTAKCVSVPGASIDPHGNMLRHFLRYFYVRDITAFLLPAELSLALPEQVTMAAFFGIVLDHNVCFLGNLYRNAFMSLLSSGLLPALLPEAPCLRPGESVTRRRF